MHAVFNGESATLHSDIFQLGTLYIFRYFGQLGLTDSFLYIIYFNVVCVCKGMILYELLIGKIPFYEITTKLERSKIPGRMAEGSLLSSPSLFLTFHEF